MIHLNTTHSQHKTDITDLTTVLTLLLIHLVENLLVRKFSAKRGAAARTASFVLFPANKNKKRRRRREK